MRRTWVKLWVDQTLRGSLIAELCPEQRWIFIGFLLLAGDSEIPGVIFRRKDADGNLIGYSDAVLADTLGVDEASIGPAKARMIEKAKITIDERGVISICNWDKYQSEYEMKKARRTNVRQDEGQKSRLDGDGDVDRDVDREREEDSPATMNISLNFSSKKWEGIAEEDKKLWAETYGNVDVPSALREMISYWDAQPASKRKINWKRAIVNRLKWLQDNGGNVRAREGRAEYRASQIGQRTTPSPNDAALRIEFTEWTSRFMAAKGYKSEEEIPFAELVTFADWKARRKDAK